MTYQELETLLTEVEGNLNKRMTHFWNRWKQEYLINLSEYHRSNGGAGNVVKENDIILVHEDHIPRGKWELSKVIELITEQDGIVRGVKVQVGNSKGKISVTKSCIPWKSELNSPLSN